MSAIYDIASGGSGNFLAVGESGLIQISTDGGLTWTPIANPLFTGINLYNAEFVSFAIDDPLAPGETISITGWIVVGDGLIAFSEDLVSWEDRTPVAYTGTVFYGAATVAEVCLVVGEAGLILDSRDGFDSYNIIVSGTAEDLYSVEIQLGGQYVCLGSGGVVIVGKIVSTNMDASLSEVLVTENYLGNEGSFGHVLIDAMEGAVESGSRISGQINKYAVTGTVGAGEVGDTYTITLDGVNYTYITLGTETNISEVVAALQALIDASAKFAAYIDGSGDIVVSSVSPPTDFTSSTAVVNAGAVADESIVTTGIQSSSTKQISVTVGGTATTGDYIVTLNGVAFTFPRVAEDNDGIAAGLQALIDASPDYEASVVGSVITITGVDAGIAYTVSLTAPAPGTLTESVLRDNLYLSGMTYYGYLEDGLQTYDYDSEQIGVYNASVAEQLLHSYAIALNGSKWRNTIREYVIADLALSYETFILKQVIETLTLEDSLSIFWAVLLEEAMTLSSTWVASAQQNILIEEPLLLEDVIRITWPKVLIEVATIGEDPDALLQKLALISESLVVSGAASSKMISDLVVALVMTMYEATSGGFGKDITETVTFTPTIAEIINFYVELIDGASFADLPSSGGRITIPLTEGLVFDDTLSVAAILQQLIAEGLLFYTDFGFDGLTFSGWVMNTENFAVTEYRDFPFNSFGRFNKEYLAAGPSGLYRLRGDKDNSQPIEAWLKTGAIDFGTSVGKTVRDAYVAFKSDGSIYLKVVTEDNIERVYQLDDGRDKVHNRRQKLERGLKACFWEFEVRNVNGADFELEQLEFVPIYLKRRVN